MFSLSFLLVFVQWSMFQTYKLSLCDVIVFKKSSTGDGTPDRLMHQALLCVLLLLHTVLSSLTHIVTDLVQDRLKMLSIVTVERER